MATIQQSIEVKVPAHTAYQQLTQFEDYPRFMEEVEAVQQIDDTHLHWTTRMSNRPVEWDAEITEQQPDRCIAWRNTSGPPNAGKVEVQPVGADASRITFTLRSEPQQMPGSSAGNNEEETAQRLRQDLARLKDLIETHGSGTGEAHSQAQDMQADVSTQSDYSLSKSADDGSADDGRFSVAEEVNFDQQSDAARRIGQMPQDANAGPGGAASAADAMGKALRQDARDETGDARLKPPMERAAPPSE